MATKHSNPLIGRRIISNIYRLSRSKKPSTARKLSYQELETSRLHVAILLQLNFMHPSTNFPTTSCSTSFNS